MRYSKTDAGVELATWLKCVFIEEFMEENCVPGFSFTIWSTMLLNTHRFLDQIQYQQSSSYFQLNFICYRLQMRDGNEYTCYPPYAKTTGEICNSIRRIYSRAVNAIGSSPSIKKQKVKRKKNTHSSRITVEFPNNLLGREESWFPSKYLK